MSLWRAQEHEPLSGRQWDADVARASIRAIVQDAEAAHAAGSWPAHPADELGDEPPPNSLYLGGAGVIWALWRLGSSLDLRGALRAALARYRALPDWGAEAHAPSLLMGETGLLVVAATIGSELADPARLAGLVRANRAHPSWELMWGSPGTMLAAHACGLDDAARDSAELLSSHWDERTDMWRHVLSGRVYPHLGPVHGFAGNVHALRGFVDADVLRARATRLLTRTAARADGLVNWPPTDRPLSESVAQMRVQWCHGAPGIVATLGDLIPLELAVAGGELTWRAGPLRKGPGLCHGTAGNGFAFLRLHALTGEPRWLVRARRFAMHALGQVEAARAAYGRGRYTLSTGDLGVALYVRACLEATAAFPVIDSFS